MATISSAGIGSGLDVNSIVSQLVALEKTPLKALEVKASTFQAQLSAFGKIQSQFSALSDVATRISAIGAWTARSASSSNDAAASITATSSAQATSFSLDVDVLAQKQSISSAALPPGTVPGSGTLTIQLGTWTGGGLSFAAGTAASVDVSVSATDSIADIAGKINGANAGVVATVFNDGTNERLLLQSKNTGVAAGFRVQSAEPALAGLVFDPELNPGTGMAAAGIPTQYGQDARARINGLAVTSASNTLTNNIPGVTIQLGATTTTNFGSVVPPLEVKAPVTMTVSENVTPAVKNVQDFVDAYNKLNTMLTELTKYDSGTKTAGLFQGDSSVTGLQNVLRNIVGSISKGANAQRLSDVGIQSQRDGSLTVNTTKLSAAANNGNDLEKLFTTNNNDPLTNGFALKFAELGRGVLATGGSVVNKIAALQGSINRNATEQDRVNTRADAFEARLRKQYSALDARMAQLTALNSYVAQQVTLWNKSTS